MSNILKRIKEFEAKQQQPYADKYFHESNIERLKKIPAITVCDYNGVTETVDLQKYFFPLLHQYSIKETHELLNSLERDFIFQPTMTTETMHQMIQCLFLDCMVLNPEYFHRGERLTLLNITLSELWPWFQKVDFHIVWKALGTETLMNIIIYFGTQFMHRLPLSHILQQIADSIKDIDNETIETMKTMPISWMMMVLDIDEV